MMLWIMLACQPEAKETIDTAPPIEPEPAAEEEVQTEIDHITIMAAANEIITSAEGGDLLQFTALAHWNTGESTVIHPLWTMTNPDVGEIDAFGLFTPS